MTRRVAVAGLLCTVIVAACERTSQVLDPVGPPEAALSIARSGPKIGPGVVEAIRQAGGADVVIALNLSAASLRSVDGPAGIERLRSQVGTLQQSVLQQVGPEEFGRVRRFQAVPALGGTVGSEAALQRLAADPLVRRIDLDVGGTGGLAGSVPQIGADERHRRGNTGAGVVVAVLDSGTDNDNPDLAGRIVAEACFGFRPGTPGFCPNGSDRQTGPGAAEDDAGHGTHVTGIVAAGGVVTPPGVAPDADIASIKVLDDCSFAGCFYSFLEIVAALDYIIVNNDRLNVRAINMSLGTFATFPGICDNATAWTIAGSMAINTLWNMGVIAFAASGNNGSGTSMPAPACLERVVSVGAVNRLDVVAGFSNSNPFTDIFAPGVGIFSLAIGGGTLPASGTSMASPHAAGCAALLIQTGEATTPATILARLRNSPVQVTDPKNGLTFPRIDCSPAPQQCTPRTADRVWSNGAPPGTVRLDDPNLYMATFDVEPFLPRSAVASAVRIGPDWERGTPAEGFMVQDVNNDGIRDVVVRWSIPALIADGRLAPGTQQLRFWGYDAVGDELFCATATVTVE
jgi:subtilisin family serine protease